MAKGRARAVPTRPDLLWRELSELQRLAVASFAEDLGIPVGAWPYLEETLDLVVSVACARRIDRYVRVEGLTKSEAWARTSEEFGLSTAEAVKKADYRRGDRALAARRKYRSTAERDSSVPDRAAGA